VRGLDSPFPSVLPLPSEGGPSVGSSSLSLWLVSLGVAVVLTLVSMALMQLVGKRPFLLPVATDGHTGDSTDVQT
jgi:hypothetical protein